jgi:hypothetical protein
MRRVRVAAGDVGGRFDATIYVFGDLPQDPRPVIDLTVDRVVFEMHGGPFPLDVAFQPKRPSALQP